MKLFLSILFNCFAIIINAQTIYSNAYGNPNNPPIIYIHGGPRGNATLFEGTTAQTLADKGYYVIVYDRRGEGRSKDTNAKFTFQESANDLNYLINKYNLSKVTLIGHSFGGIVATLYTKNNTEKVEKLILVGALFSQQETYNHILKEVHKLAKKQNDYSTITEINEIKKLDKNSAEYRKKCYEIASKYKFFDMPFPTEEFKKLDKNYKKGEFAKTNIRNDSAPLLFYKNEKRVNIDTKNELKEIQQNKVKVFAIYGNQDQIFSTKQRKDMKQLVGSKNYYSRDNCSHYPFVDQQTIFLKNIVQIMNTK